MSFAARTVVRRASSQGRKFSTMFESKNKIPEVRQKFYSNPAVGAENPTYLKEPGDRIVFGIAFSGMLLGTSCILKGLYDMSYGVNKLKH